MSPTLRRALLGAFVAGACLAVGHAQVSDESRLKAATVTKFGQFVQWPTDLRSSRSSFDICLAPGHGFGSLMEELTTDVRIQNLPVAVRSVSAPDRLVGCHVLYVGRLSDGNRRLLGRAAQLPILTVGDDAQFLRSGGVINLRVIGGRVRFDIDAGHAQRVGLLMSSQLLRLAQTVQGPR
jgi:hypothetical protein